jgi:hypothetical protein
MVKFDYTVVDDPIEENDLCSTLGHYWAQFGSILKDSSELTWNPVLCRRCGVVDSDQTPLFYRKGV